MRAKKRGTRWLRQDQKRNWIGKIAAIKLKLTGTGSQPDERSPGVMAARRVAMAPARVNTLARVSPRIKTLTSISSIFASRSLDHDSIIYIFFSLSTPLPLSSYTSHPLFTLPRYPTCRHILPTPSQPYPFRQIAVFTTRRPAFLNQGLHSSRTTHNEPNV